jgi:hypothetical protein
MRKRRKINCKRQRVRTVLRLCVHFISYGAKEKSHKNMLLLQILLSEYIKLFNLF